MRLSRDGGLGGQQPMEKHKFHWFHKNKSPHMLSWVRCGIWLYGYLIVAFFLTLYLKKTIGPPALKKVMTPNPGILKTCSYSLK